MAQHQFYVSDASEVDYSNLEKDERLAINNKLRELFYDELAKTKNKKATTSTKAL